MNLHLMHLERKDGPELKFRDFQFKVKEVTDEGVFSGYASVFGVLDSYREIVAPGAFAESLVKIAASGQILPALWQHMSSEPIGGYESMTEDDSGLHVEGFLLKDEVNRAREAFALMKRKIVSGLSIGYYVLDDSYNEKERTRTLKKLELVEVSIVTFPANPDARIDTIKSKLAHGGLPTLREFSALLREQGFTRSQADLIANRGLKSLLGSWDMTSATAQAKQMGTTIAIPTTF